jgi:hypothetical protein
MLGYHYGLSGKLNLLPLARVITSNNIGLHIGQIRQTMAENFSVGMEFIRLKAVRFGCNWYILQNGCALSSSTTLLFKSSIVPYDLGARCQQHCAIMKGLFHFH